MLDYHDVFQMISLHETSSKPTVTSVSEQHCCMIIYSTMNTSHIQSRKIMVIDSNSHQSWGHCWCHRRMGGCGLCSVKAIVLHKYNNDTFYPFFVFDWFSSTRSRHNILQCIIYLAQGQNDRWQHIYPLTFVDHIPRVHFLHVCSHFCTVEQHDITKRQYMKNEFYYNAV